ncbi:MAG: hypothetical protein ACYTFI_26940 [Planctomycetota bacterium]
MTSKDGRRRISNGEAPSPGLSSWRWNLAALLVFLLAAAAVYGEVWREDARSVVPARDFQHRGAQLTTRMDVTLETWLVARNAYTLTHRPHRLFDTEHCAPWEKTMTLGIPMITMGVVAVMAAGPLGASLLAPFTSPFSTWTPNPYEMLASVLPGLDSIRVVHRLGAGVHLVLSVLAGMGLAALLRMSGRHGRFAAPALILLAAFEVLRAPALGFERSYHWVVESIRPRASGSVASPPA